MVALMSASCSKKDDAVNPTPPVQPTNPMIAHIVGKWINTATYLDGQLTLSSNVYRNSFEFIQDGGVILTATNYTSYRREYTSWTLSTDNTTLTFTDNSINHYLDDTYIVFKTPSAPDFNTMTLDHQDSGHTYRYELSKQ